MSKTIEVWHDETSDVDSPTWCVSLCDEDGSEIKCLSTHDDESDAIEAGREAAQERGLGLYSRSKHGPMTEVVSAGTARMEGMLLRHGSKFSGNNVEDEAENWIDNGFDAEDADDWCEIGCWDAATAAELRDAGLTPKQAEDASNKLIEDCDEPAEEYTDGDPIYAVCNSDISAKVIIDAAKS